MDRLVRERRILRASFTRTYNGLRSMLENTPRQMGEIQVQFTMLKDKTSELEDANLKVMDALLNDESNEEQVFETEGRVVDEYKQKYLEMKWQINQLVDDATQRENERAETSHQQETTRTFKLPKIELKKFSGDIREWLQFWSQFKNIHEDAKIPKEDKFQYLLQAMVAESRASELVHSYPPTAENYDKVITSLKNRFGKEDLLVEVYVRELLKLVLNNATTPKGKVSLASVYDKLETHIRSLESLGVTTDTCAAMLYPLVESSLPEDLLRAWQRQSSTAMYNAAGREPGANVPGVITPKDRLTNLMNFLQAEVESEERIAMAVNGFGLKEENSSSKEKSKKKGVESSPKVATAAGLLVVKENKATECIFCSEGHESQFCEKAKKMTMDERQEIVKQKNACFYCLTKGHSRKWCKYNQKCAWCGKKHVLLMCRGITTPSQSMKTQANPPTQNSEENSLANLTMNAEVFLQTLRVKLRNENKEGVIRAVIDGRSHRSYITQKAAEAMGYTSEGRQEIIHLLFGGAKTRPVEHQGYVVHVSSLDNSYACNFLALDQEKICHNIPVVNSGSWVQELRQKGVRLTDVGRSEESISLLIGADIMGKLLTGRIENLRCGATAIETRLGWTIVGKVSQESPRVDAALLAVSMLTTEAKVEDLWSLEVLGITDPSEKKKTEEQQEEMKLRFRQTAEINEEGRYEVELPWKENHPPIPDNKAAAMKRLESTTRRLRSDNLLEDYERVFESWLNDGIIEKVPPAEMNDHGYYLPHRHVVKENSTTRIRPVFDASAKGKDTPSLNQCLETGPNLIELIPKILLRFRQKELGVIADIRQAFLQIGITRKDRDVLRFLWWDREDRSKIEIHRHRRVVFGVSSSPFLLGATIELHLEKELEKAESVEEQAVIKKLASSFYVDNCVASLDTEEDLQRFQQTATMVMQSRGFDLRGWERSGPMSPESTAVLGLAWDKGEDSLRLSGTGFEEEINGKITKRYILSIAQRLLDPIGFASPVLLRLKLLLQKLWSDNVGWDTEVKEDVKAEFVNWFENIRLLRGLRVQRWAFGTGQTSFHIFVDASQHAYAAAIYARTESPSQINVQLLLAKARVTPKGRTTTPRLELLAATVGARLMKSVTDALNVEEAEAHYWSDSTTVLAWIKREKQWATFVWNRVQEIRQLSDPNEWKHLPGKINPADLPSRGCSAQQLLESRWWEGPDWLRRPREDWPDAQGETDETEVNSECRKSTTKRKEKHLEGKLSAGEEFALSNACTTHSNVQESWFMERISKYSKIVRMVAWILRFETNCRNQRPRDSGELSAKEIAAAELRVFRMVQEAIFGGIEDPRIRGLDVYKDKTGLIRLKTLISDRRDDLGFRHPIVLDNRHPLVHRLIHYRHEKLNHAGVQIVLNHLREQVWILAGRRTVRAILKKCAVCRRHQSIRLEAPPAALPEERTRDAAAFEVSGVDFAGPLYLKGGQRVWICLFTCAVYRAVHLEIASDLSTQVFLEALRRFIARRGRSIIYSDNGTNFTGAGNLLRKVNWKKIQEYSTANRIEWRFNPPSAAWWGGWWERLVRSVKELLRRVLRKACLTAEELYTTLCDCEATINSRPITYLSEDPKQPAALTPAMFIQDIQENGVPDLDSIDGKNLNRRLRYRQKLREDLRQRFRIEYLGLLTRRKTHPKRIFLPIHEGDVVLIGSENHKRADWPLAKVIKVYHGRDGHVRVVRLKTSTGELVRPIQRLFPLEMSGAYESGEHKSVASKENQEPEKRETAEMSSDQQEGSHDSAEQKEAQVEDVSQKK